MLTSYSNFIITLPHHSLTNNTYISIEENTTGKSDSEIAKLNLFVHELPSSNFPDVSERPTLTVGGVDISGQIIGVLALSWKGETYHFLLDSADPFNKLAVSKWICKQKAIIVFDDLFDEIQLNAEVRLGAGARYWFLANHAKQDAMKLGAMCSVLLMVLATEEIQNDGEPILRDFLGFYLHENSTTVLDAFRAGLECIERTPEASKIRNRARFVSRGDFHELKRPPYQADSSAEEDASSRRIVEKFPLPDDCMQELQEAGALFFRQYASRAVGYLVTAPDKLLSIAPYSCAATVPCVVVRDEADFDECVGNWHSLSVFNVESLDLTGCVTFVTFDRREGAEGAICMPDHPLIPAFSDAVEIGELAVILCSPSRAMLFILSFDDTDMDELQAASVQSTNFRPYPMYDEKTLEEAAMKHGHLNKSTSEGWGMEITHVLTAQVDSVV